MENRLDHNCLKTALRLLTRRDHSSLELSIKLNQRGFRSDQAQVVIDECLRLNYLNDERFAHAMTQHLKRKGYGPRHIDRTLHAKGVAPELINDCLNHYCHEIAQADDCRRALAKKIKQIDRLKNPVNLKTRLQRFLLGRGFSVPIIRQALEDMRVQKNG